MSKSNGSTGGRAAASRITKAASAKVAPARKAASAKASPAPADTKLRVINRKFAFGGDGTKRRLSWDAARAAKSVAAYVAAGGRRKYLPRFVAAGAIALG